MADVDARPTWVRYAVNRRTRRSQMLVRCWLGVVCVVAVSLPLFLTEMSSYVWAVSVPALLAVGTAWEWLAFRWVDRHRGWH